MLVYRISHIGFIEDLSGYGAWKNGGRWNSRGKEVLYAAGSLSLAAWEVFVNLPKEFLPSGLSSAVIFIPEEIPLKEIPEKNLPPDWHSTPHPKALREIGDYWIESVETLVLKIPSAVIRSEHNFLINPKHADFPKVIIQSVQPFEFDPRVFK